MKIFEYDKNKNKLYYTCIDQISHRFFIWVTTTCYGINGEVVDSRQGSAESLNVKVDYDI